MRENHEPITVCVADADIVQASRVTKLLDGAGYRVVRLHKARLLYAALQSHRVDLIVLGGLLLDGNALVTLAGLRDSGYHIPVILFSGLWNDNHSAGVLRKHTEVVRVLRPPLVDQDLMNHVRSVVGMPSMAGSQDSGEEKSAFYVERTFAIRALVDESLADISEEEAA